MLIRPVQPEEKDLFNKAARHPTQSWEWGDFRAANGQKVARLGVFSDEGQLEEAVQVTFHAVPIFGGTAGYYSKGPMPTPEILNALKDIGKQHNSLFIKLEPNAYALATEANAFAGYREQLQSAGAAEAKRLFTTYTYVKDLTAPETEILESLKSKTRYNLRVAQKRGVEIMEDTSEAGMEEYLELLRLTTERQGFYAHNESYFRTMWKTLGNSGWLKILKAVYEGKTLSVWIIFLFNGVGYYPYGASSREHRDVMANNLMMWEALMLAKREGCTRFDVWGSLGPDPDPKDKWYGFHRFKEGCSGELMQSPPTFDLPLNPPVYKLFTMADNLRWKLLRLRAKLGR